MSVRGGGGLRLFLLRNLALGLDLNLILGFTISKDQPLSQPKETTPTRARTESRCVEVLMTRRTLALLLPARSGTLEGVA